MSSRPTTPKQYPNRGEKVPPPDPSQLEPYLVVTFGLTKKELAIIMSSWLIAVGPDKNKGYYPSKPLVKKALLDRSKPSSKWKSYYVVKVHGQPLHRLADAENLLKEIQLRQMTESEPEEVCPPSIPSCMGSDGDHEQDEMEDTIENRCPDPDQTTIVREGSTLGIQRQKKTITNRNKNAIIVEDLSSDDSQVRCFFLFAFSFNVKFSIVVCVAFLKTFIAFSLTLSLV